MNCALSLLGLLTLVVAGSAAAATTATPQSAVDSLLAADRAYAGASASQPAATGIGALFAEKTFVMLPRGQVANDAKSARAALAADANLAGAKATWTPVWAGISADATQGFTLGYLTLRYEDGREVPQKYLAYWVREHDAWKVAAYKRRGRAAGEVSTSLIAPLLPAALVAPGDAKASEATGKLAGAAERAFSDDAQRIGLGPAFAHWGTANAVNLGGPDDAAIVIGSDAIAKVVSAGEAPGGSSVEWSADRVVAASSGDMAVTIGDIRLNVKPTDPNAPAKFPFFTVWHRADAKAPWRYVAE
jgi:hypothetical protein